MSLINDALRRASQSEKDRPRRAATSSGMEPVPTASNPRLSLFLAAVVVVALLLAGWFFWQWWVMRNNVGRTVVAANVAPPPKPQVMTQPPVVPKPAPAPVVQAAPMKPAPVPVVAAAPPVVAPPVAPPVAAPVAAVPVTAPDGLPSASDYHQSPWPVDLKLNAIFFSQANPRVLLNGNIYGPGDQIQGVVVKKIEKDKVTLEWNGHSRELMMEQ
jgi:hypothetical protein